MNAQAQLDQALGYAQDGAYADAIRILSELVDALPEEGIVFQALGVVLLQADQSAEAVRALKRACFLLGETSGVVEMLAIAHAESGSPTEALVLFDRLEARHDFRPTAGHFLNRGNALNKAGQPLDAARSFEKAVRLDPDAHQAWGNWALVLKGQGKKRQALACLKKAFALSPSSVEYRLNLANTLADLGHRSEAEVLLRDLRRDVPESGLIAAALARVLLNGGEVKEALSLLKLACELNPNEAKFHLNYGVLLAMSGRVNEPLEHFQKAIRLKPNYWAAWVDMGNLLVDLGKLEEAKRCFELVLERVPDHQDALAGLGGLLNREGAHQEALVCLEKGWRSDSPLSVNYAVAHATASIGVGRADGAVALLVRMLDAPRPNPDRSLLLHALGRAHDKQGQYRQAFDSYVQSNALRCLNFDPLAHAAEVTRTIEAFGAESLDSIELIGSPSDAPIFIVGMPRSGTSLIEQILSSHSQVHGAGELEFVRLMASMIGSLAGGSLMDGLRKVSPKEFERNATEHLVGLLSQSERASFVTDKMPSNFLYLGLIQKLYPNAKIIHSKRNMLDTCVSCFRQNFNASYSYTTRLDWLGAFYREYERMMAHWKSVLTLPIYEMNYESLVTNPQEEIPRLVEFCGLDMEPECLVPHKNKRVVHTASRAQVRQPIYTGSVGYADRYLEFLRPLVQAASKP